MSASHPELDEQRPRCPVHAGVLVGGASVRMGRAKSSLRLEGTSFVERIVAALSPRVQRVFLLGDGPTPPLPSELERVADVPGIAGPMAGILAALRREREACWVIAACDLPLVRSEAIDWLLAQRRPDRCAILPRVATDRPEPLLAVYEPESLKLVERLAARGIHSPHRLAGEQGVFVPAPPANLRECWTNVNTPEDLERLG